MSVLVVGSINADIFMEVQRMPLLGETLAASGSRLLIGGKGANQAVAAALSGGISTSFMGQLGDDHATKMKMHLTQAGVTLDPASQVHSAVVSGQAMIFLLASSGDNAIVIVPGANAVWPTALTPAMQESIRHASVVMLQCEIPAYVNHMVAVEAKSAGVTVIWVHVELFIRHIFF
jgi:ribokinase